MSKLESPGYAENMLLPENRPQLLERFKEAKQYLGSQKQEEISRQKYQEQQTREATPEYKQQQAADSYARAQRAREEFIRKNPYENLEEWHKVNAKDRGHDAALEKLTPPPKPYTPPKFYTAEGFMADPEYQTQINQRLTADRERLAAQQAQTEAARKSYLDQATASKLAFEQQTANMRRTLAQEREQDPTQRAIRNLQQQQQAQLGPAQQMYLQFINQQQAQGNEINPVLLQEMQQQATQPSYGASQFAPQRKRRNLYQEVLEQFDPERFNPDYYPENGAI